MLRTVSRYLPIASLFLLGTVLLAAGCGPKQEKTQVNVAAAASLKNALLALEKDYEKDNSRIDLVYNFASSGTLQKQIEQGAPADLFISAGQKQAVYLEKKGLTAGEIINLLGNRLVLIVPAGSNITGLDDLTGSGIENIALGAPETVPAGKYAQEALNNLGLWRKILPKLVLAKDVKQVLSYVETGNADAGIVYSSDAGGSSKTTVVFEFPASSHSPVIYPAVLLKEGTQKEEAARFLGWLREDGAQKIFTQHGFLPGP